MVFNRLAMSSASKKVPQLAHETTNALRLDLERYFVGPLKACGVFQDRFGRLRRQFDVDAWGSWDGKTLTLVEDFVYEDGETERRTWSIDKLEDGVYRGRAEGVIGEAEGRVVDNTFTWSYSFALPVNGRNWTVKFNDWMFLQNDGVLINRADVSKWGVRIGQVICVFRKPPHHLRVVQ